MSAFPSTPIALLTGHGGPVHAVAYSSGASSYVLTGSADRNIRLYNPQKAPPTTHPISSTSPPGLVNKYTAHGHEILSIDVNTDNDKFVSAGGDKTLYLWDVSTAQTIRRFSGHGARINRGIFGGDGDSVLISGSFDGTVRIWDLRASGGKPIMVLSDARDAVTDVAVADGEVLAASVDGRVRNYDLRRGMCDVDVLGAPCTSLCVSKKGTEILIGTLDDTVRLMARESGEVLQKYVGEGFVNRDLRVRSVLGLNDSVVVSGSDEGDVFVWDIMGGEYLHRFRHAEMKEVKGKGGVGVQRSGKKDFVSAVAFCKTRREWASAGGDGTVVVWGTER